MSFASHPRTVTFEVDGSSIQTATFPVTAFDSNGNSVPVSVESVVTFSNPAGSPFRHEVRKATSAKGIASVSVDSRVLQYTVDNLTITP
jgi:hypothetical protein